MYTLTRGPSKLATQRRTAWQQVEQQLDGSQSGESTCGPVQYVEKNPNPGLKNFVPIDLEEWWAQQFLAKIQNCS
ncbi:MAPK regulated corepressor interacting protein 2 [Indicator indicator]|uniref:MAPK regulated corepressor interacting protein 2 n=1 Tax=Indicator indicator TaxID=1002788 RepID=UPI0023E012A3|nr:MAPK regulated corepressor interacting protein 2 [Indicator indicator]